MVKTKGSPFGSRRAVKKGKIEKMTEEFGEQLDKSIIQKLDAKI